MPDEVVDAKTSVERLQLQAETWKQSVATGILNGLALDYLSTIFPVMGLDITFLIAYLCVARSVWHWLNVVGGALGLLGTLAMGRQVTENLHLRNLTYELLAGNILTCRQTLRRSVSHVTELKSIGAQIDFGI